MVSGAFSVENHCPDMALLTVICTSLGGTPVPPLSKSATILRPMKRDITKIL